MSFTPSAPRRMMAALSGLPSGLWAVHKQQQQQQHVMNAFTADLHQGRNKIVPQQHLSAHAGISATCQLNIMSVDAYVCKVTKPSGDGRGSTLRM
jgi:hypothetical protein